MDQIPRVFTQCPIGCLKVTRNAKAQIRWYPAGLLNNDEKMWVVQHDVPGGLYIC